MMAHLIDKDALVAEIEKGINGRNDWLLDEYRKGYHDALTMLKKYLSTLEVKEVDLEKELDEWIKYGPHTNYPWCTIPDAIKITAEHFFELGMSVSNKVQKGE